MSGKVYLVGAGPGDPDLLTLRAARLLERARVVVHDRLVSDAILAMIGAGARRIDVGKSATRHRFAQHEINALLVALARAGSEVIRLKGGDPFVFGRGGEEALHLAEHRIAFEVVPGVTAATACAAYAGIPITHRGLATGVRLVTGHCRGDQPLDLDWRALADPDATLAIYMGLGHASRLADGLIDAGLAPGTPAAIIESGTTTGQRRHLTRLDRIARVAVDEAVASPALLVIGRVVSLAPTLDWFEPMASGIDGPRELKVASGG